jgi:hypothetical protein
MVTRARVSTVVTAVLPSVLAELEGHQVFQSSPTTAP